MSGGKLTTWWEATSYRDRPEPVTVSEERPETITLAGKNRRARKNSRRRAYFPTWEQARDWMEIEAARDVATAKRDLQRARSRLGNIRSLKDPAP